LALCGACETNGSPPPDEPPDAAAEPQPDLPTPPEAAEQASETATDPNPEAGAEDAAPVETSGPEEAFEEAQPELPPPAEVDVLEPDVYLPACGNGIKDPGEACDEGDANSDSLPDTCRTTCVLPWCGDGVVDQGEGCDDQNAHQYDGCKSSCQSAAALPLPGPGDIIFTELMVNPAKAPDPDGEWIELSNLTAGALNLGGCVLRDTGTDEVLLGNPDGLQLIGAQNRLVLGASDKAAVNGGAPVKAAYTSMLLDNTGDEIELRCGEVLVDTVAWSSLTFAIPNGASLSLDPDQHTAQANDDPASWCAGAETYGLGDLGTPGAANPACPKLDTQIDLCTLTESGAGVAYAGVARAVTVRVLEPGLTDQTPGVDAPAGVVVEVGHGPAASQPGDAWVWSAAKPLAGWDDPSEDGWVGEVVVGTVTSVDAAARASRDGGATWTLCDGNQEPGYQAEAALQLEVAASPCVGVVCDQPGPPACVEDGVTLATPIGPGACVPLGETATTCSYPLVMTPCGELGLFCKEALCQGEIGPPEVVGQFLFSELMIAPLAVESYLGEWFEIVNPTSTALDLDGCVLGDSANDVHSIAGPLVVPPGGVVVFGRSGDLSENGGVPVDYALGDEVQLKDLSDDLRLTCGEILIDQVAWSSIWKVKKGVSFALSPYQEDAAANDPLAAWCAGTKPYGAGDLGTPGKRNPACPGDEEPLDACRLVGAAWVAHAAGDVEVFEVRVSEAGVTDVSPGTDTAPDFQVEVGYGPPGASPTDSSWVWAPAKPSAGWDAGLDSEAAPGEDAWVGPLTIPPPGSWRVAFRASADGGHTYGLCDRDGSANGWQEAQAIELLAEPSACYPSPCAGLTTVCEGTQIVEPSGPAICVLTADAASCLFVATPVEDCATYGATCAGGVCVDFPPSPAPGGVVFTELMLAPEMGPAGEWIEIVNPTQERWDLAGCTLSTEGGAWELPPGAAGQLLIEPGESWVLARSDGAIAPETPDLVWVNLALANQVGWLSLECQGGLVDQVAWDASLGWKLAPHTAIALSKGWTDALANDQAWAWCAGGSPGAPNAWCPPVDAIVDDCRLVMPLNATLDAGATLKVDGEITDAGTTEASAGADIAPGLLAQVGLGPDGGDPVTGPGWTWVDALPQDSYPDGNPSSDYYVGHLTLDLPGEYDLAVRFSVDGGASWSVCDSNGALDGYQPSAAGQLTVEPTACVPNPCGTKPAECVGDDLVGYLEPVCQEDLEAETGYQCAWPSAEVGCASLGLTCADGGCVGLGAPESPGDLVVSEVMRDSADPEPDDREWIEVFNPTAMPFDLRGCVLRDADTDVHTLTAPLPVVVPPGGFLVLGGASEIAGAEVPVGYVWKGLVLSNTHDEIRLQCGATLIDGVDWSIGWPGASGVAMQLSLDKLDAVQNDGAGAWCPAFATFGTEGEHGSPGTINGNCP
jgi:cysteine-rich repeat protein